MSFYIRVRFENIVHIVDQYDRSRARVVRDRGHTTVESVLGVSTVELRAIADLADKITEMFCAREQQMPRARKEENINFMIDAGMEYICPRAADEMRRYRDTNNRIIAARP